MYVNPIWITLIQVLFGLLLCSFSITSAASNQYIIILTYTHHTHSQTHIPDHSHCTHTLTHSYLHTHTHSSHACTHTHTHTTHTHHTHTHSHTLHMYSLTQAAANFQWETMENLHPHSCAPVATPTKGTQLHTVYCHSQRLLRLGEEGEERGDRGEGGEEREGGGERGEGKEGGWGRRKRRGLQQCVHNYYCVTLPSPSPSSLPSCSSPPTPPIPSPPSSPFLPPSSQSSCSPCYSHLLLLEVGPACPPSSFLRFEVYAVDNSQADREADPSCKDSEKVVRVGRREG